MLASRYPAPSLPASCSATTGRILLPPTSGISPAPRSSGMGMSRASRFYLMSYNSLQCIGWAIALKRITSSCFASKSFHGAYASAGDLTCFLQAISFLEVLHAAIGLVPSRVMLTLMQWGGRTHFLLAIVRQIPEVQELPQVFITFAAWSVSEVTVCVTGAAWHLTIHGDQFQVIRYSHYALTGTGFFPQCLTYLRYTAFIVLYPVGIGPGEMWLMYRSLPLIKRRSLYANLFDSLPFSYHAFVQALLSCYPFLWLKLYLHLLKQRRSKLGTRHSKMS